MKIIDQWYKTKLGDIVFAVNENEMNPLQNRLSKYVAGGHIESESIYVTKFGDIKTNSKVLGSAFHRKFSKGDILFGTRRAYLKKAGIATFDGICANTTLVLRPKHHDFATGLLPFLVQWEKFTEFAVAKSVGSTNPYVRWRDLASFEFYLPSYNEQFKMQTLFWSIQKSIDTLKELINKLKIYKAAKMDELLTRGIGHKKFKKVKWLFGKEIEIPEKWEIKQVKEIFELLKTGTNSRSDLTDDGDVGYIHYGDIHKKWHLILDCNTAEIPLIDSKKVAKVTKLKNGDLIIADASEDHEGSGASILIKNANNKTIVSGLHTIAMRDSNKITHSEFRAYITSSRLVKTQIISYVTGISVYGLSKSNLNTIRIPIPPLPEQIQIASILSGIDVIIKDTRDHLSKLKAMRKSIINEKLTPPKMENEIV